MYRVMHIARQRFSGRGALVLLTAILGAFAEGSLANEVSASLHENAMIAVARSETDLIAFRHDIHRFPELAGREKRTSAKIAGALNELGFEVREGVGGYGLVATLRGSRQGPLVAFRADMDAVAGPAADPVSFRSQVEGVNHTCGHDIHSTIGVGLAAAFAAIQSELPGQIMLIFQPSEEAGVGADNMIEAGVFGDQLPEAIFALHTAPFDLGTLAVLPDGMMAGRTRIDVTLSGHGDLAAVAQAVKKEISGIGNVTFETMFSFWTEPFVLIDFLPIAQMQSGETVVSAFVMSAGLRERPKINERLRRSVASLATGDIQVGVAFVQALEGVNNDPELLKRASMGIQKWSPGLNVVATPGVIPAFSEDFGSFQRSVPGVMYMLGVNNPVTGTVGFPHSPDYVADDAAIRIGTEAILAAMLEVMTDQ